MHVALFVQRHPPAVGGSEAYFARLADYHRACGDDVTVWTTTANSLADFARPHSPLPDGTGVRRFRPLAFPLRRYILKAASLVPVRPWQCLTLPCNPVCPGMWRASRQYAGPLDAVHATAFPYAFPILCGLRMARRRRVPFLLTPFLHLGDPANPRDKTRRQYTQPALRWLLNQADVVFVQTPSEHAAALGLGVPEPRVVLQGLGVDVEECTGGNRDAARERWGVSQGNVVVGHLANNSVEKGTVDLLRAAERLRRDVPELRIVLAGPEMPNFARFWAGYASKDIVTRLGVLSESAKRDFFAGLDVFALPSRTDAFGLVLLESWANGKPVVAYRAGGPADVVRDGVDGLLAACEDVHSLPGAVRELCRSRELRDRLGAAGRDRLGADFAWPAKLSLVREVTAAAAGHHPPENQPAGEAENRGRPHDGGS